MDAGWAFVVCSSFGSVHVSASGKMVVSKFDYMKILALFSIGQYRLLLESKTVSVMWIFFPTDYFISTNILLPL